MSKKWLVASAGTALVVEGPDELAMWWSDLAPQIPGTSDEPLSVGLGPETLAVADDATRTDARRMINGHVHAAHLGNDTLSLHGVALSKGRHAVVLLGGHGAGKSLTGLAMIQELGWRPVAGDTCLIRISTAAEPRVVGGTRSYIVRRHETSRWFPTLAVSGGDGDRVELSGRFTPHGAPTSISLVGIALVSIDGIETATHRLPRSGHVAANAIYRASRHLIDKVLDDPAQDPLSLVEGPELARRRLYLVRQLVATTGCRWFRGTPLAMATAIDEMADGGQRWEG
jgi:hypothetical protein